MITVVGLGYVGLTAALGFAEKGLDVIGYDKNKHLLDLLRDGEIPIHEPGLKEALNRTYNKYLTITDDPELAYQSDIIFYCVGTPSREDGSADLSILTASVKETLLHADPERYIILVIKSTVPPGTCKNAIKPVIESSGRRSGIEFGLVNNPEFLREGFGWKDFMKPDRIVLGGDDEKSLNLVSEIYKDFGAPINRVSTNTSEFIKYGSNSILATMISFANEMSLIADAIGDIEIEKTFHALHQDHRWTGSPAQMASYFFPGAGFGGYCLPKDTAALISCSREAGYEPALLESVLNTNLRIKLQAAEKIARAAEKNDRIAILGLAFKPDTGDVRETVARNIIESLLDKGYHNIVAYDPLAAENFAQAFGLKIEYASSLEEAVEGSSLVVLLTAWKEFIEKRNYLKNFRVLDFRYVLK